MEISNLPNRPHAASQLQGPAALPQINLVETELPAAKAVNAISDARQPDLKAKSTAAENSGPQEANTDQKIGSQPRDRTRRQTVMDWSTNQPVFRVIDERSGQTLSQTPDQALLRLRAYVRQQNIAMMQKSPDPAA